MLRPLCAESRDEARDACGIGIVSRAIAIAMFALFEPRLQAIPCAAAPAGFFRAQLLVETGGVTSWMRSGSRFTLRSDSNTSAGPLVKMLSR